MASTFSTDPCSQAFQSLFNTQLDTPFSSRLSPGDCVTLGRPLHSPPSPQHQRLISSSPRFLWNVQTRVCLGATVKFKSKEMPSSFTTRNQSEATLVRFRYVERMGMGDRNICSWREQKGEWEDMKEKMNTKLYPQEFLVKRRHLKVYKLT